MFFLKCAKSFGRFSSKNTSNAAKYVNICREGRERGVLERTVKPTPTVTRKTETVMVGLDSLIQLETIVPVVMITFDASYYWNL